MYYSIVYVKLSKIKDIITFAAAKSALIAFEQNMGHQL
jgi:hypothetical protein